MIIGIGCDIIEVERIKKFLSKETFKKKVYTEKEIAYCESRGVHAPECYAARFAAKEAVAKALGEGFRKGELQEISIVHDELGQPQVELTGEFAKIAKAQGCQHIHLSLSHLATVAMAQAIAEGK